MRSAPLLLLSILVSLIPPFAISQTNYCCNAPNFGDAWCHSSACLGAGCRNEPDPITGQSQANYLCDDLSNCICSGMVKYQSMSFCTVKKSCANAKLGYTAGADKATALLQSTPTTQCLDAITTAVCAYHFPRCEDDDKRFQRVCYDTCDNLATQCGKLKLDDIVLQQGRCQDPPPSDGTAVIGRDKCTAGAHLLGLQVLVAVAPLLLLLQVV